MSGELEGFIGTENDMRGYVVANDVKDARAKADTLEHDWDSKEGTLRPQNQSQWIAIDGSIDIVLSQLWASHPKQADCKSALKKSISIMQFD